MDDSVLKNNSSKWKSINAKQKKKHKTMHYCFEYIRKLQVF